MNKEIPSESFSLIFQGFTKDKYNKFYPENINYEGNEVIITLSLEAKNKNYADNLSDILNEFITKKIKNYPLLSLSIRKANNNLSFDLKREIYIQNNYDMENIINEIGDILLIFKNNIKFEDFLKLNFDDFFINLFSFIFSINIKIKILINY